MEERASETEFELTHCPVCGAKPDSKNICWAVVSPWIRELNVTKRRVCRYLICVDCKLGWFSLRYSSAGLERLYSNYRGTRYTSVRNRWETWYDGDYNSGHSNRDWIQSRAVAILEFLNGKVDLSSSEVVDIGGDTGEIASILGAKSYRVVEISDRVTVPTNETRAIKSIAILAHVLEHVSFPRAFLANLLQTYDDVYVEVPWGVPDITKRRRSMFRLVLGLLASFSPVTWRPFANPAAGRKRPPQLLRVSEHLTFFEEHAFKRLLADDPGGARLISCRSSEILSPDRASPIKVVQVLLRGAKP